jgi:hypothetical protein
MSLLRRFLGRAAMALFVARPVPASRPRADDGFPFGLEMTLDVARQPGSKRLPTLEIGDSGEVTSNCGARAARASFRCRQYRDLSSPAAGGSCLSAGAGAGRR